MSDIEPLIQRANSPGPAARLKERNTRTIHETGVPAKSVGLACEACRIP